MVEKGGQWVRSPTHTHINYSRIVETEENGRWLPTEAILNDLRSIFRLPSNGRTPRRCRSCVFIDKQLEMKCNSKWNAKEASCSKDVDPGHPVCNRPRVSSVCKAWIGVPPRPPVYLFVDIENPILWIRISFDFALIFNCFACPAPLSFSTSFQ